VKETGAGGYSGGEMHRVGQEESDEEHSQKGGVAGYSMLPGERGEEQLEKRQRING
jgi:hypothetical protein